ncbi:putative PI3-kinase [Leptomonas pyrrhocoris]|uniref:phosphatidylinositol 3-kinase n=1 Tax=Leptomonas pyrrhocoris TaxID=157538 RepID=A0A0M9FZW6_LEPPY|nr:putative PI3-kinase [Leptomonas pyrrhocoris]XP_015657746.1 putative PI3-kinase [Leptomonas pyrrhocoris]KPA79306.1 putative PI3-kinase [Leptomonas pyrrhocoris]KPA79307.1 putative PI3-kinase [Leptomonas pyrrhocoris]|eukprot:XP_015657745.1 putative PI3-kinase [Leptomonas pyrrhocoris]
MTSTSTQLIADVLRRPSSVDRLHWTLPEPPFRTAQDYAATEFLYRLRLCSVLVRGSLLLNALAQGGPLGCSPAPAPSSVNASSTALQYPVQVTAQLTYMAEPLSPIVESSAVYAASVNASPNASSSPSSVSPDEQRVEFVFAEEWIIFPLELCDVPLDATCELHLWYNDIDVGAASFHVYAVEGELRVGQQHLSLNSTAAVPTTAEGPPMDDATALLAEYHRGRFPVIPWLDGLSVHQLEARQARRARSTMLRSAAVGADAAEEAALLVFYLPTATTAVFFEPAAALGAREMEPLLTGVDAASADGSVTAERSREHAGDYAQRLFPDQYTFFKDFNLSEAKAAITAKSQYFVSESSAPPGPKERHQLASLLRRPPLQLDHGSSGGAGGAGVGGGGAVNRLEETRLLWKYRRFICKDGRFLLPFMRSVDWANTHSTERRAACALMHQWARPGFADLLACLSFYFDRVAPVRQYAVRLLRQEGDGRLCQVVFQLLQAVRYDSADGELATFLLDRAVGCWEMCSTVYTMLTVEVALERRRAGGPGKAGENSANASGSSPPPAQARERPAWGAVFESLLRRLANRLSQQSPLFVSRLRQQHAMHRVLQQLSKQVQQSALDRLGKTSLGNKLIAKQSCGLHALFGTLRHRAPRRANSATADNGQSNSSFATDAASTQQERSPVNSVVRAAWEEEEEDNDREGEEGATAAAAAGNGKEQQEVNAPTSSANLSSATTPLHGSRTRRGTQSVAGVSQQRGTTAATAVDVLDRYGVVTLPIYPAVPITGILPNSLYIFKSAKLPMRLTFKAIRPAGVQSGPTMVSTVSSSTVTSAAPAALAPPSASSPAAACLLTPLAMQRQQRTVSTQRTAGSTANVNSNSSGEVSSAFVEDPVGSVEEDTVPLAMMFKYDDDVRQDQLIVQLLRVMDDLLQQDGLQLYLTPYRVIATGPREGLVEIVPQATTFLNVQREVLKYLRVYNPTAELLRQAMDRYTRSFAGYCVSTFVLGIGDRHLENILLTQDGRLLHIDFGYVFGNDPKPFPPPMKINREMVEVLGGPQSTGFTEFKLYCCSAYNTLRKHAALLLHLLLLGAHAENMPQVTGDGGDPRVNLLKVQERLRLDLTNAQATQYLQNVIADSVGSIFTNLWDVLHAAAQATRS